MDKILEKTLELKQNLYDLKEFQEYFRLKKLYEDNEEIKSIEKLMLLNKDNPKELEKLKNEYDSNPLVINYLAAKKEVEEILISVKEILEK